MSKSETPSSNDKENEGWGIAPWICIVLAVLFLAAGGYTAYRDRPGSSTKEAWGKAGARGDYWGGHFAAASGLAGTLILFAALLLQGKELKLQRKELRDSREVAKQQAEALDEQTSELKRQNEQLRQQILLTASYNETQLLLSIAEQCMKIDDKGPPDHLLRAGFRRIALLESTDREHSFEMVLFFAAAVRRTSSAQNLSAQLDMAVESLGTNSEHLHRLYVGDHDPHNQRCWMEIAKEVLQTGKLP